ncbi:MAG: hypothetical protein PHV34_00565 [Verrucomicrobiae bacterium]|nr:hypothetical protein [Verrucomicrobiae bacterium]
MHDRFGARVQFHVHGKRGRFELAQLSDRFKADWEAHADWIRLAFHQKESPESDFSYKDSTYEKVRQDYQEISGEIARFAGPEVLSPFVTIHHAACSKDGMRALRDCGVKGLGSASWRSPNGVLAACYGLSHEETLKLDRYGFVQCEETGLCFVMLDVILHEPVFTIADLKTQIKHLMSETDRWHHLEVGFEEWAFDPKHPGFMPDAEERAIKVLSFLDELEIQPVFLEEVVS